MDRNRRGAGVAVPVHASLSARRAWIEIQAAAGCPGQPSGVALRKESVDRNILGLVVLAASLVALRKESVDRNSNHTNHMQQCVVALRKESVDRNCPAWQGIRCLRVALRKESVDRNYNGPYSGARALRSLSARRAWIEIGNVVVTAIPHVVALRKESVDRNLSLVLILSMSTSSLSARRAWIEIAQCRYTR